MDPFIPVPPEHYGGIERVIYDIANQFVKSGNRVTLVAGPNSKSPDKLITYGENGLLSAKLNYKVSYKVYRILQSEIKTHDVIHNFGRLVFIAPFIWTDIRKVQTYMRYVSCKNIQSFDKLRPRNLSYTAVSDAIKLTGNTPKSHWDTVYNCAPVEQFDFKPDTSPDSYLVFLGRIERCKGLHNAIKVATLVQRQLIIAGNISDLEEERLYYQQEIKPFIDGKLIKYIGPVNNKQKNELLGNASALLTPIEWFEPFPIIIPEAYACGTPVLGFKNGGVPEGIEHGVTGFVSETVSEMVEHVKLIYKLDRNKCRLAAENKYSDRTIANKYIEIYKKNN
jgi:glycosyltransferase involved in cell wall biosynthesis